MSVTISFCLEDGVELPRKMGEELLRRAVALVGALAREFGWTSLGHARLRAGEDWLLLPAEGAEE